MSTDAPLTGWYLDPRDPSIENRWHDGRIIASRPLNSKRGRPARLAMLWLAILGLASGVSFICIALLYGGYEAVVDGSVMLNYFAYLLIGGTLFISGAVIGALGLHAMAVRR